MPFHMFTFRPSPSADIFPLQFSIFFVIVFFLYTNWFLTGISTTSNLIDLILTTLWSGWSLFFLRHPVSPVSFSGIREFFARAPTVNCITVTSVFYSLSFLEQVPYIYRSFRFLLFSLYVPMEQQNLLDEKFVLVDQQVRSGLKGFIFYLKVREKCMRFIFYDFFQFMYVLYVTMELVS